MNSSNYQPVLYMDTLFSPLNAGTASSNLYTLLHMCALQISPLFLAISGGLIACIMH